MGRGYANLTSTLLICGPPEESLERGAGGCGLGAQRRRMRRLRRFVAGNAVDAAIELGRWDEAEVSWTSCPVTPDGVGSAWG